jgi:hypothetical protein
VLDAAATGHDVEEWERRAFDYTHEIDQFAPDRLLPDLLTDLDEVRVRVANCPEHLRSRLLRVCGQLSALTAITLVSAGDPRSADRYWRTALRAVDQVGDRSLRALVRGRRAVFALYDQRPATSVLSLADEAIAVAGGSPGAGLASGYAARAQALARLGQQREARMALDGLAQIFTRLPDSVRDDRVSQLGGWGEQRLRHVQSHVSAHEGRLGDATAAQDAALALYPLTHCIGRAQVQMHRATCLIVAGDPSEGARHVVRTLDALPAAHRQDALVHRTAALALDVVPDAALSLPAVAEARERLALASGAS